MGLARWALRLAEYEFDLQHRPDKSNTNADALSRNPHPTPKVSPFIDISTSAVLSSLAGIDTEYNMSNLNLLPSDTLLAMSSIIPDTDVSDSSETGLRDSHLLPEQLIALKPSLDEFRTEQQSCSETGTIYKHLKTTLSNAK